MFKLKILRFYKLDFLPQASKFQNFNLKKNFNSESAGFCPLRRN